MYVLHISDLREYYDYDYDRYYVLIYCCEVVHKGKTVISSFPFKKGYAIIFSLKQRQPIQVSEFGQLSDFTFKIISLQLRPNGNTDLTLI